MYKRLLAQYKSILNFVWPEWFYCPAVLFHATMTTTTLIWQTAYQAVRTCEIKNKIYAALTQMFLASTFVAALTVISFYVCGRL